MEESLELVNYTEDCLELMYRRVIYGVRDQGPTSQIWVRSSRLHGNDRCFLCPVFRFGVALALF